jgi:hypothetical protein
MSVVQSRTNGGSLGGSRTFIEHVATSLILSALACSHWCSHPSTLAQGALHSGIERMLWQELCISRAPQMVASLASLLWPTSPPLLLLRGGHARPLHHDVSLLQDLQVKLPTAPVLGRPAVRVGSVRARVLELHPLTLL